MSKVPLCYYEWLRGGRVFEAHRLLYHTVSGPRTVWVDRPEPFLRGQLKFRTRRGAEAYSKVNLSAAKVDRRGTFADDASYFNAELQDTSGASMVSFL